MIDLNAVCLVLVVPALMVGLMFVVIDAARPLQATPEDTRLRPEQRQTLVDNGWTETELDEMERRP